MRQHEAKLCVKERRVRDLKCCGLVVTYFLKVSYKVYVMGAFICDPLHCAKTIFLLFGKLQNVNSPASLTFQTKFQKVQAVLSYDVASRSEKTP